MVTRIQYRRTKGWRKPPNTVYCGRPGRLGNPYPTAAEYREKVLPHLTEEQLEPLLQADHAGCWCPPGADCHADDLVKLANDILARRAAATPETPE